MKRAILCVALAFAATAGAQELNKGGKTTVIRVNNQTKQVEAVHVPGILNAGQKVESAKFEQIALNSEVAGIKFDVSNELDLTTSTSSWRYYYTPYYRNAYYGIYYGNYYGNYGYYAGYRYPGYYAPYYVTPYYYYYSPYYTYYYFRW